MNAQKYYKRMLEAEESKIGFLFGIHWTIIICTFMILMVLWNFVLIEAVFLYSVLSFLFLYSLNKLKESLTRWKKN